MKLKTVSLAAAAIAFSVYCGTVFAEGTTTTETKDPVKKGKKIDNMSPEKKAELLKKFDKDGDGILSASEQAEMKKAMWEERALKKYDKDGDGKLSDEERAEAEKDKAEHMKRKGKRGNKENSKGTDTKTE